MALLWFSRGRCPYIPCPAKSPVSGTKFGMSDFFFKVQAEGGLNNDAMVGDFQDDL